MSGRRYPTAEQLLDEAVEQSGLTDFGPGDFREGLEVLLDSLEHDGDLAPGTDEAVVGESRRRLVNRLELEAWYAAHPEVEAVVMVGRHRLRLKEVPVRMRERSGGRSSITAFRSVYYMVKVTLAIFVGLFRRSVTPLEEDET